MPEPIYRSVHQTLTNLLTILSQQGDEDAIAALSDMQTTDYEIIDDKPGEHVEVLLEYSDKTYLVTEQGVTVCEKPNNTEK